LYVPTLYFLTAAPGQFQLTFGLLILSLDLHDLIG
jgi:hypothetical protein